MTLLQSLNETKKRVNLRDSQQITNNRSTPEDMTYDAATRTTTLTSECGSLSSKLVMPVFGHREALRQAGEVNDRMVLLGDYQPSREGLHSEVVLIFRLMPYHDRPSILCLCAMFDCKLRNLFA